MKNKSSVISNIGFLLFLVLCTLSSCNIKTNKIEGMKFYSYYHQRSSHEVSSFSLNSDNVTEIQLSFGKDSVIVSPKIIYNSINLPAALQSMVKKGCTELGYKYSINGDKLFIAEAGVSETAFKLHDGDLAFEDGTYFYRVPINELPEKLQIERIQKIAEINTKDAESLLKNCISCN